jgi:adenine-specific DNA-methyltransferase
MKNVLGQYMTTSKLLQEKVYEFIFNSPKVILEPSVGQGHLVDYIKSKIDSILFDTYEIDPKLGIKNTNYIDFLEAKIDKYYTTIVGNPPYLKTKNGNLYIDFIKKCFELLEENGELIFIIPSDFFQLKQSSKLLTEMASKGSFTHIFYPNDEKLFENASIDITIFRYTKSKITRNVLCNGINKKLFIENGMVTFNSNTSKNLVKLNQHFDIHVGLVSGKEQVFKNNEFGNIQMITSDETNEKYIFINEFPTKNEKLNTYLIENKPELMKRKIIKMNETNWFKFGAIRNLKIMEPEIPKQCIYIYNLTRKTNIAFKSNVSYFGGNLICLIPKNDVNLDVVVKYINSNSFKDNFLFSGRYKIGHRQLFNSFIQV